MAVVLAVALGLMGGTLRPAVAQGFAGADAEWDGASAAQVGLTGRAAAVPASGADLATDTTRALVERAPGLLASRVIDPDSTYRDYPEQDTTGTLRERPIPLTVFGYYRLFLYYRDITDPYPNLAPFERTYGVGDGYREPMLSLNILGRPSGRSSFGTELFVFTPYDGEEGAVNNVVSLNLGVNFYGNFRTEVGTFGVRAGGIHWYNLSPFTIGVYQVLDRFTIFDRTPWEGVNGVAKYNSYYETGQANPGDQRWNYQAFQGLILDGRQLPGDVGFDAFWGKTQPNGGLPGALTDPSETVANEGEAGDVPTYLGFNGEARVLPSFISGGRLQKSFGDNLVGYNGIYSYRALDSLSAARREYQVHTVSFDADVMGVSVSGELGASKFESPDLSPPWGEALMVRARVPAEMTYFPLDVQLYQVGRHFFNENGEIATGNNPDLRADPRCAVTAGSGSTGGAITQVNQLAHNRRGVNFNTAWETGPAKLGVGWGLAHELAPTTTELSYVHRINGLAVSRVYNPFPAEAVCATSFGPFARQFSFFRGVFERVQTTDVDQVTGVAPGRKYYHAVDLQAKLRAEVLDRPLYFFYLGSFGSANRSLTVLPRDDDTYVFVQYHEFDVYYELLKGFIVAGYLGLENARGGRFTALDDESGEPRDQNATGVGVGFDWTIARNVGLYVRHRWMHFEDQSFAIDTYRGRELTVELKIFI